ncbi:MarR family transcriptional regulator [Kribbella sp. NPDC006257]|jgi:DNA-binding MarR family transcriptional regulator|uniref:MarR family winged helix-turn-helix transcriptional regulator n=1 Tax=Kribbella sp. NPDC006257 TaxID=3156738 RepID=UPI0033A02AAD
MHVNDPYAPQTPVEGVLHAFTRIGRRLKAKQPGDTIDHSAHLVLFVLRCNGALRLSDLAARMEIDASTASRHVRALEQAGLIQRSVDPDDGRAFRVELTEQGTAEWETAAKRRMELLTQAMEGWTDSDIETFEKLMTRFADGVTSIVDARGGDGKAWADKGWAAAAAAAAHQNTEKNVEKTR